MSLVATRATIGVAQVQLLAANGSRLSYSVANRDSVNAFIGATGVTAITGYQISPGESVSIGGDTGPVFMIGAGAGAANAVHVLEVIQS